MVIVLAILAVVTSVATREVGHVQDQHRFEASQRGLEEVHAAILGTPALRALDGTPLVPGFVADMGRYPTSLGELWTNTTGTAFALRPADDDTGVFVASGWNGPYVRLPMGSSGLKDGWGREFLFATTGDGIEFGHNGSDGSGSASSSGYDRDIAIHCSEEEAAASLYGQLAFDEDHPDDAVGSWIVRAYGPDASDATRIRSWDASVNIATGTVRSAVWTLTGLTPGARALRAYRTGSGTNTASAVRYVALRSGLNGPVVLRIDWGY